MRRKASTSSGEGLAAIGGWTAEGEAGGDSLAGREVDRTGEGGGRLARRWPPESVGPAVPPPPVPIMAADPDPDPDPDPAAPPCQGSAAAAAAAATVPVMPPSAPTSKDTLELWPFLRPGAPPSPCGPVSPV